MILRKLCGLLALAGLAPFAFAGDDGIRNYTAYSPTFASSGQPTARQLEALRDDGLERVIYIAYSDHDGSLPHEDRLAKQLGIEYVQIPVEWNAPTRSDFEMFASVMRQDPDKPTLLHCQANFRASAFSMLYRVIYEGVALAEAKADMNAVWTPNETWTTFVRDVLTAADIDPDCDGCDWTPSGPAD